MARSKPTMLITPSVYDGEGFRLNKDTITISDPMGASAFAQIVTPADEQYFADLARDFGGSYIMQDAQADIARVSISSYPKYLYSNNQMYNHMLCM